MPRVQRCLRSCLRRCIVDHRPLSVPQSALCECVLSRSRRRRASPPIMGKSTADHRATAACRIEGGRRWERGCALFSAAQWPLQAESSAARQRAPPHALVASSERISTHRSPGGSAESGRVMDVAACDCTDACGRRSATVRLVSTRLQPAAVAVDVLLPPRSAIAWPAPSACLLSRLLSPSLVVPLLPPPSSRGRSLADSERKGSSTSDGGAALLTAACCYVAAPRDAKECAGVVRGGGDSGFLGRSLAGCCRAAVLPHSHSRQQQTASSIHLMAAWPCRRRSQCPLPSLVQPPRIAATHCSNSPSSPSTRSFSAAALAPPQHLLSSPHAPCLALQPAPLQPARMLMVAAAAALAIRRCQKAQHLRAQFPQAGDAKRANSSSRPCQRRTVLRRKEWFSTQ